MLAPRYLEGLADELAEIYSRLEADVLSDIARRLAVLGKITEPSEWQAKMLAENGALRKSVQKTLARYSRRIAAEIERLCADALERSRDADNRIIFGATGRKLTASSAQVLLATIQKTKSDLSRLTLTTAADSERLFVREANAAYMKTVSGAFSYSDAMKDAAVSLCKEGITVVRYENSRPVRRSIESAVRMNVITGVNQNAAEVTLNDCEELGCDLVEVSAHAGSRPEHEEWQGKVYSLSGTSGKYPPFSLLRYGEATGICGINCRHSFYPFFEGEKGHWAQGALDALAGETVSYEGKEMTRYEAEQSQRKMERTLRRYKRLAAVQGAAGADAEAAKGKAKEWSARIKDFCAKTGLRRERAREFVAGNAEDEEARRRSAD